MLFYYDRISVFQSRRLIKDVADSSIRRINFIHECFSSIIAYIAFMTHFNQMVLDSPYRNDRFGPSFIAYIGDINFFNRKLSRN